ncbi:MAG TPA: hypothetical protein PLK30_13775 [Blastocatellia bacterium]|nr:hypothetical protein [Blastocatellia bacterium]
MPENSDPKAAPPPSRWENSRVSRLNSDPRAMLICDGLLGMCSPEPGKCEIGFLSLYDSTDPKLNEHKPEIMVIAVENGKPETLFRLQWQRKAPPFSRLRLRLENGRDNVRFFLTDGLEDPAKDFREMVDLEHALNDGKPVSFRPGAFSPLLEVTHGDFHTLLLTPQTYTAHQIGGPDKKPLGHLAYMTAANLHFASENGSVVLEMKGSILEGWVKLGKWSVNNRKIFVVVSNNCQDKNGKKCEDEAFKKTKKADRTTDFHLYFDAVLNPAKRYEIICDQDPDFPKFEGVLSPDVWVALVEAGLIRAVQGAKPFEFETESTNPTPCGSSGFGGSGSLEGGG